MLPKYTLSSMNLEPLSILKVDYISSLVAYLKATSCILRKFYFQYTSTLWVYFKYASKVCFKYTVVVPNSYYLKYIVIILELCFRSTYNVLSVLLKLCFRSTQNMLPKYTSLILKVYFK